MYLFQLSKEHLPLATAEVVELLELKQKPKQQDNLLLIKSIQKKHVKKIPRLAYTKAVYEHIFTVPITRLEKTMVATKWQKHYETDFSLRIEGGDKQQEPHFADLIWRKLKHPKVNLKEAKTQFFIFFTKKSAVGSKLLWHNQEHFESRKTHRRPAPHPSSLHPKLARCMVNLAASKSIVDPFCGSGGILIEAGLMGLNISGSDLDRIQVNRAHMNLAFYNLPTKKIEQKDALTIKKAPAIVTDLPYGRNTKSAAVDELMLQFLQHIKTKRIVLGAPDFIPVEKIIKKTKWKIKYSFTYFLHQHLSKKIMLLVS